MTATLLKFVRYISMEEWFTRASEPLKKNVAQVPTQYSGEEFKEQYKEVIDAGFGY